MTRTEGPDAQTRVLACCGGMVVVFGMERMSFEVLRVLREGGAEVHCVLNDWENERIRPLAESIGASWSTGPYGHLLVRTRNPLRLLAHFWNIARTSLLLLRDQRRFRATHVFVPEFVSLLRNAPALLLLRACGVRVVLRMATAPDRGRFYDALWRFVLAPLATTFVAQSDFTRRRALEVGVPAQKLVVVKNTIPRRDVARGADRKLVDLAKARRTLLCVGQLAPFKGTHVAVDATIELLHRGRDVQLVVAGDRPKWPPERVTYVEEIERRVRANGHSDRVHFAGSVANVLEVMESSFLLVAPYLGEESFGIVVLEAKSRGLPVVAFPLGAIPELIAHRETGYLCERMDRDGLIDGIEFFLSDSLAWESARRASREAYRSSANDSSPEAFARNWRSLFGM